MVIEMKTKTNKLLKSIGACGLALTLMAPVAAPMIETGLTTIAQAADSNASGTFTLTIHKRQGSKSQADGTATGADGTRNDGYTAPNDDTTGLNNNGQNLDGITFTITKIVPATNGKVSDMNADTPTSYQTDTTTPVSKSGETDKNGDLSFKDLQQGYYLVHEVDQAGITKVKDFIVSLPMTDADGKALDNTQIWPKNYIDKNDQVLNPSKTITNGDSALTDNVALGDTVKWNVTGHVPLTAYIAPHQTSAGDNTGEQFGTFALSDPIWTDVLSYDATTPVTGYYIDKDGNKQTLTLTDDFTVTQGAETTNAAGQKFTPLIIKLTNAGLKKAAGLDVGFNFATKIIAVPTATDKTSTNGGKDSLITNTVDAFVDNVQENIPDRHESTTAPVGADGSRYVDGSIATDKPSDPIDPTKPSDSATPTLSMGGADITKVDENNKAITSTTVPEGYSAEFGLYQNDGSGNKVPVNYVKGMDTTNMVNPVEGQPIIFKTNENGQAWLNGLTNAGQYFIKETKAPTGYLINTDYIPVTADMDQTDFNNQITNAKDNFSGNLPITGGQLRIIMMTVGSIIMIACGALLYIRKRRENEDAEETK